MDGDGVVVVVVLVVVLLLGIDACKQRPCTSTKITHRSCSGQARSESSATISKAGIWGVVSTDSELADLEVTSAPQQIQFRGEGDVT